MQRITVDFDAPSGSYCDTDEYECTMAHDFDNYCIAFNAELHYSGSRRIKCPACLAACKESEGRG